MQRLSKLLIIALVSVGLVVPTIPAQASNDDFRSTLGEEFWLHFSENLDYTSLSIRPTFLPSIYLSAFVDTNVVITWPDGTSESRLVLGGAVSEVEAYSKIFPTDAYNFTSTYDAGTSGAQGVRQTGVRVVADAPISVYKANLGASSSAAAVVYPVSFLGTRYRLIGPDIVDVASDQCRKLPRFSVLAVEDNTTITISLKDPFGVAADETIIRTLDAGESFTKGTTSYLCGINKPLGFGYSGSLVVSDKKVLVSTSSQLTATRTPEVKAADFLFEFLTPVSTWGKTFVLPTHDELALEPSQFLVVADSNATVLTLNGTVLATLSEGETLRVVGSNTAPLADFLQSSEPIAVMQINGGVDYNDPIIFNPRVDGDNESLLITPNEQFLNDVLITTPNSTGRFDYHRLLIVAQDNDLSNVEVDGTGLPPGTFQSIATTGYSVARVAVSAGQHRVSSVGGIAVYVYGFDQRDAYAYSGGNGLVDTTQFVGGTQDTGFKSVSQIVAQATAQVPDAVSTLAANISGPDVVLTWQAPNANGASITDYEVEFSTDGSVWTVFADGVSAATGATVTGLTPSVTYSFRVQALNIIGPSLAGTPVSITIAPPNSDATPYSGPVVSSIESRNSGNRVGAMKSGSIAGISGVRLSQVTGAFIDGLVVEILKQSDGTMEIQIPLELESGFHNLVLTGPFGTLTVQDFVRVQNAVVPSTARSSGFWTKRMGNSVKVYAKNVVGAGKVQFMHEGREFAWVRANDETDRKLREANGSYYLVRTYQLKPGKNAFEIYLDGERVWRAAYTLR